MKASRNISNLVEIMAALRTPKTGCPWDLKQDFSTIAPYTIEEAYEVADAIERQDWDHLRDELGDLLLQPIYHARMAQEAGLFDFGDVVEAIITKMIRRHPHVFGSKEEREAGMERGAWEKIKVQEVKDKAAISNADNPAKTVKPSLLDDVPSTMPALQTAVKLQKRASSIGFDWEEPSQVLEKLREETNEMQQAIANKDKTQIKGEIGDLLFTLANLARHLGIEPDGALRSTNRKFCKRFGHIEQGLNKKGLSLEEASLDEMDALWDEAKAEEDNNFHAKI